MRSETCKSSWGVIYTLFGVDPTSGASCADYNLYPELLLSIKSLRWSNPGIPITLFADAKIIEGAKDMVDGIRTLPDTDFVPATNQFNSFYEFGTRLQRGYLHKIWSMLRTPYTHTVFLDCDTYIRQPLNELALALEHSDIVICRESYIDWADDKDIFLDSGLRGYAHPHCFNSGVIGFSSSPEVREFFQHWLIRYCSTLMRQGKLTDQDMLNFLLEKKPNVKVCEMPNLRFNARIDIKELADSMRNDDLLDKVAIFHAHLFRHSEKQRIVEEVSPEIAGFLKEIGEFAF